ncbi:SKP1 component, POZ domain [Phytophthora cactorum]|nr:SKP1 component, POZ domain [Phytophthora cactorum]
MMAFSPVGGITDKTPEKTRATFGITEEFTEEEQLMQTLVTDEQEGDDMQEMPLPNVKALVLAKVVEFCQHHKDAPMDEIHKPLKCNVLGESGDEWATQFVDVAEQELLFELLITWKQTGNAFYRLRCASIQFRCASPPGTHEHLIKKVTTFMRKLKTVKRIAKLKQNGCFYKPVSLREFRWSGCYRMLQRLEDFRPYLHLFQDDCEVDRDLSADDSADDLRRLPIVDFIPSMSEQRTIALLLDEMTAFDVITGKLQRQDMTVATVLDIFDIVRDEYDDMEKYLAVDADIVESPVFERSLAKLQAGVETALLRSERKVLARLVVAPRSSSVHCNYAHHKDDEAKTCR